MSNAVMSDWPSGVANTGWPSEPSAMLMPGRIQGWPAGTQRAANPATTLLSQAVAWWDVEQYRDGDRFLRNRGTGGELLNLRLGSALAPNSNDPRYLAPENQGYVYLPGVASNYLSVPDEAALDITGDIEIIWCGTLDDAAAGSQSLVTKWQVSGQFAYRVMASSGAIQYRWSADGVNITEKQADHGVASGEKVWIKVRHDVDNGAGGNDVTFFKSSDGYTWVQFGTTQTTAGTTSIYSGTSQVEVGSLFNGAGLMAGRVYRAQVLSGIDGTTVLDIDCDAITSGSATSFTAGTGQTVTINRSTSGRKSVAMPSRHKGGRPVMLLGTDDYLECLDNWQQGLLNFGQGDSFTVLAVFRMPAVTASQHIIGKRDSISASPNTSIGYNVRTGTGVAVCILDDGVTTPNSQPTLTTSSLNVLTMRRDTSGRTVQAYVGTVAPVATRDATAGVTNTHRFRIGSIASNGNYADMEFYGAAIWRRPLSADEVSTLSRYFTGRIA